MKRPIVSTTIRGTCNSGKTTTLMEMIGSTLKEYEDKKVLLITSEESSLTVMERMKGMGLGLDPYMPSRQHPNLYIVEFNPRSVNPARWQTGTDDLMRWIFEKQFDVVAVDDDRKLMEDIIEEDRHNDVSRHYFSTVNEIEPAKKRVEVQTPNVDMYSLGA